MFTEFDKREIFDTMVAPKIHELLQICNKERIPIFISACIKNTEKKSEYKSDMYAAVSNDIILKDDKFTKFVNVINGFETVPASQVLEMDFDE